MAHKISVKKNYTASIWIKSKIGSVHFLENLGRKNLYGENFLNLQNSVCVFFLTLKVIGTQTQLFAILWKLWYTKINGKTCHKPKFQKAKWRL